jgi:hypothetical protein
VNISVHSVAQSIQTSENNAGPVNLTRSLHAIMRSGAAESTGRLSWERRVVTVFGGSGFIGRHRVRRLAAEGGVVRVGVRDAEGAAFLKMFGEAGEETFLSSDRRLNGGVDEPGWRTSFLQGWQCGGSL